MSGKDQDYRIFVGGLAWDVTDRQLESAFGRYGKVIDCQVRNFPGFSFFLNYFMRNVRYFLRI